MESSADHFYRHDVDANGITIRETSGLGGGQIEYHDGLIYVSTGQILDVGDDTTSIADTLTGGTSVAIDAAANTVYFTEAELRRHAVDRHPGVRPHHA